MKSLRAKSHCVRQPIRQRFSLLVERLEDRASPTSLIIEAVGGGLPSLYAGPVVNRGDAAPLRGIDAVLADALQPPQSTRVPRDVDPPTQDQTKPTAAAASQDVPPTPLRTETPLDGQHFFVGLTADPLGDPFADPFGQAKPNEPLDIGSGMPSEPASPASGPAGDAGSAGGAGGDSGGGGGGAGAMSDEPNVPSLDSGANGGTPSAPPAGQANPNPPPGVESSPLTPPGTPPGAAAPTLVQNAARPGVQFEINRGQVSASEVQFLARAGGYVTYFTSTATVLALARPRTDDLGPLARKATPQSRMVDVVAMNFVGADPNDPPPCPPSRNTCLFGGLIV